MHKKQLNKKMSYAYDKTFFVLFFNSIAKI